MLSFVQIESSGRPTSPSSKAMPMPMPMPSGPETASQTQMETSSDLEQVRSVARSFVPEGGRTGRSGGVRFDDDDNGHGPDVVTAPDVPPPDVTPPAAFRDDHRPGVEVLQSLWHPRKNKFRLAGAALANFTNGLHDSAAGALLPYMERHYHVGYGLVSLIFVCTAVGSILAAVLLDRMKRRLGRARTLLLAEFLRALAYIPLLTTTAPFAAVNVGFFLAGFAMSINIAIANTFCASLQQSGAALGVIHGAYGIGGISGPLIATAVVVALGGEAGGGSTTPSSDETDPSPDATTFFSRYYFVPLGLCVVTAVVCAWGFAGYERDTVSDDDCGEAPSRPPSQTPSQTPSRTPSRATSRVRSTKRPRGARTVSSSQIPLRTLESSPPTPSPWEEGTPGGGSFYFGEPSSSVASPPSVHLRGNTQPRDEAVIAAPADEESQTGPTNSRSATPPLGDFVENPTPTPTPTSASSSPLQRLRATLAEPSARVVLLGALFLFQYQGAEVSVAGWVASFLLADRAAKTSVVGTITAGFWVGITLGRFLLAATPSLHRMAGGARLGRWLSRWLTPRRFVYGCVAGAALFELLVWFVPSVVGDAVAVAIVGLLLGPVYPTAAGLLMRGLSRRERVAGVGIMGAFGSAGGAAAPFVTGMVAQAKGPVVLHPVVLVLAAGMLLVWYLVPEEEKPME